MRVITGLSPDAREVIDTGTARSYKDRLAIQGIDNSHNVATITSMWFRYESGQLPEWVSGTNPEYDEVLDKHPEIHFAAKMLAGKKYPKAKRLMTASILGFFIAYTVANGCDSDMIESMVKDIDSGLGLDEDSPIYILREVLMNERVSRKFKPWHILAASIIAFNAAQKGAVINKKALKWVAGTPQKPAVFPKFLVGKVK